MADAMGQRFGCVMVIDDSAVDLFIASHIINKANFSQRLLVYRTAPEALEYLNANQGDTHLLPDIIFLDIYMPIVDGFDFMDAYDKLSPTLKGHCKVFMLSSTTDRAEVVQVLERENVQGFVEKPITIEFLERIP